jgi:hypothetical protein
MPKYELKTKTNDASVEKFLKAIKDKKKQEDSFKLLDIFSKVTGKEPKMWGTSIVGYGSYHYKYASGHEGDMPITGFSPRKESLTLYLMGGIEYFQNHSEKLGKFKTGKGCLYIKSLDDVDVNILKNLIKDSVQFMKEKFLK